jgi:hypothetical protein
MADGKRLHENVALWTPAFSWYWIVAAEHTFAAQFRTAPHDDTMI